MAEVTEEQLAELEAKRAAAREALVRDRQEREAAASAEKAAFEERANAAKELAEARRRKKQQDEEYEEREKWQREHEHTPHDNIHQKSQKELSNEYYSQFKTNPPANSQQKSAMHDIAETAVEEHESAKELNYLSHVSRTKEIEEKREAAKRKSHPRIPAFETKYKREQAREQTARQSFEPVVNEVVTNTIVEASNLGKTRTHVPANPPISRTTLPLFENKAVKTTGEEVPHPPKPYSEVERTYSSYTGAYRKESINAEVFDMMNVDTEAQNTHGVDFDVVNAGGSKADELAAKTKQIAG